MAAGKNAASAFFEEQGFLSIDADKLVHGLVEKKKDQIIRRFSEPAAEKGIVFVRPDGTIDRRALGALLFSDPELLKAQEAIIHPAADEELNSFIDSNPDRDIILNATVLYKTPVIKRCDGVIFVTAPVVKRFFRARKRDGMPVMQILRRFYSQRKIFANYQKLNSDIYRVRNTGSRENLYIRLESVLQTIRNR